MFFLDKKQFKNQVVTQNQALMASKHTKSLIIL